MLFRQQNYRYIPLEILPKSHSPYNIHYAIELQKNAVNLTKPKMDSSMNEVLPPPLLRDSMRFQMIGRIINTPCGSCDK
jgi:hypothetical protein